MNRSVKIVAALALAGGLSACGLTGDLTRPDPLWGQGDENLEPAELPTSGSSGLPKLPERESGSTDDQPDADDELMGGN